MTQQFNDLNIEVTPLVEDIFYVALAAKGSISQSLGGNALKRVTEKHCCTYEDIADAAEKAKKMIDNIQRYGIPCYNWE